MMIVEEKRTWWCQRWWNEKKGCVENGVERGWGWKGIVEDENEEKGWLRNDIDF